MAELGAESVAPPGRRKSGRSGGPAPGTAVASSSYSASGLPCEGRDNNNNNEKKKEKKKKK